MAKRLMSWPSKVRPKTAAVTIRTREKACQRIPSSALAEVLKVG